MGNPPPKDRLFFPSGILIDPVDRESDPVDIEAMLEGPIDDVVLPRPAKELPGPRFMFIANGNNDHNYSAGTLAVLDLREFWRAWYDPQRHDPEQDTCVAARARAEVQLANVTAGLDETTKELVREAYRACDARDPRRGGLDPYCHTVQTPAGDRFRCVQPRGTSVVVTKETNDEERRLLTLAAENRATPCRRLPLANDIVECDERLFMRNAVQVGDFASSLTHSIEEGGVLRLWLPVRGDPSVTYVDVTVADTPEQEFRDRIRFECDQGAEGEPDDALGTCGTTHRLGQLSTGEEERLGREPYNTAIWGGPPVDSPAGPSPSSSHRLAFVSHLNGSSLSLIDMDGTDGTGKPAIVDFANLYNGLGGFGLAIRPCFAAGQGPMGMADLETNIPTVTQQCQRPLVYTSFRTAGQLSSFTASVLERENCSVGCDPQVLGYRDIIPSLVLDGSVRAGMSILGDLAFADPRGDRLLVVQTNPGALLSLNTSLGADNEPLDIPAAPPIELCAEPSRMKIYQEYDELGRPGQRYALISCFGAALLYIIDLDAMRVADTVIVGTGPHDIAIDSGREAAYVINNLEASISVVDLSRYRPTRFQELARIGLQEPVSQ